jgi:CheY-like chemotaxis protein
VDDDPGMRQAYGFLLKTFFPDIEIIFAVNGEEGVSKAIEIVPDLTILDGYMPIKGGLEALRDMKKLEATRDIPVIIISALIKNIEADATRLGADVMPKPFESIQLIELIRERISA